MFGVIHFRTRGRQPDIFRTHNEREKPEILGSPEILILIQDVLATKSFAQGYLIYFILIFSSSLWSWVGFWRYGVELMGFGTCGARPSGIFGVGGLNIKIEE